ncbi:MAG TPA: hypothetical protein IGS52_16495 [Oscillatoriaceae cyanobacterium M33_DOE_052]|uniref:Uncharacterized protein n=1 Tax=Planktothricoides sp. SpSt-374 TaxID=2282167 RepID=A0A7C3ZNV9_9CYAN|nr:hypothetical protein [Oscillatoriaceae cyanobacterium M33_DOE_052]
MGHLTRGAPDSPVVRICGASSCPWDTLRAEAVGKQNTNSYTGKDRVERESKTKAAAKRVRGEPNQG